MSVFLYIIFTLAIFITFTIKGEGGDGTLSFPPCMFATDLAVECDGHTSAAVHSFYQLLYVRAPKKKKKSVYTFGPMHPHHFVCIKR